MSLILCIDDNQIALYARKLVLESAGYSVIATDDVEQAVQLFTASDVRLVLSDYLLRGKMGTELAAEMKRLKPDVPVVILSGVAEMPEGIENADLFLSKTEGPCTILRVISELLSAS